MQRIAASRSFAAVLGILFLAFALFLGWKAMRVSSPTAVQSSNDDNLGGTAAPAQAAEDSELRPQTPAERTRAPQLPAVLKTASRTPSASQSSVAENGPEPSPYTRQLVAGLTSLDLSRGPITQEQADEWKKKLQSLTSQGAAAVPAIREFLAENREVTFGTAAGDLLGQSSLRSAFINALGQIGGPEATSVTLQTLQSSTLPSEIKQLAQVLEQQAPGQYQQETISAVTEVLNMASSGQLPAGWDVATLFKVLQNYGGSASVSSLEQLQGPWRYYATMALAGLPEGEGVSALVSEVQDPSAGGKRDFAYQMLSQSAVRYPDASSALLQQAKANQIPDTAWTKIATGLAGDQYQIGDPPAASDSNGGTAVGLKTYHIASGNQNFYSLPLAADPQVIQQRLAFIDQLLGTTSSPVAQAALQSARATLAGAGGGK
jgi:hypothetical protein